MGGKKGIACIALALAMTPPAAAADAGAELRSQTERMARLADLASGEAFYLLLDPQRRSLKLMYQGAVLNEYPLLRLELGRRELLFMDRDLPSKWHESIWDGASLEPTRVIARKTIIPPDPSAVPDPEEEVVMPPTPEEAVPAPGRYKIRYREGLVLEIVGDGKSANRPGFWRRSMEAAGHKADDIAAALSLKESESVRLKLVLKDEQARMLYRALPAGSRFVIDRP